MNSAALGRAIRDAGKSFLSSRLGDLYDKRKELDTEEGFDKIAVWADQEAIYWKEQTNHLIIGLFTIFQLLDYQLGLCQIVNCQMVK